MRTPNAEQGLHPSVQADTLALWGCDFGSGSVVQDHVGGRHLMAASAPSWASGLIGQRVEIGADPFVDFVSAPGADAASMAGSWTASVWVRLDDVPVGTVSLLAYGGTGVAIPADNKLLDIAIQGPDLFPVWGWRDAGGAWVSGVSTAKLAFGKWQLITVVKGFNGVDYDVTLYLNGSPAGTWLGLATSSGGASALWQLFDGENSKFKEGAICSASVRTSAAASAEPRADWRRGMGWVTPNGAPADVSLSVTIKPPWIASAVDLSDLRGEDWLVDAQISASVDQGTQSAQLRLRRSIYGVSLAPGMTASPLNQDPLPSPANPGPDTTSFAELLSFGAELIIYAQRGLTPQALFVGAIDSIDWGSDLITIKARDLGGELVDAYIEETRDYNVGTTNPVETTMSSILADNMVAPPALYTPVSPGWIIGPFSQRREPTFAALKALATQLGWLVGYRWDGLTQGFRLTLYDPERNRTRVDGAIEPTDYQALGGVKKNRSKVRNKIRVAYSDATQPEIGRDQNDDPVYPRNSYTVSDAGSIAAYGTRFMEIAESSSSNIDTPAEAQAMADALLADLANPDVHLSGAMASLWEIELGDVLRFAPDGRHFDTTHFGAVYSISHTFRGGRAKTSITTKTIPSGGWHSHFEREARTGRAQPPALSAEDARSQAGSRFVVGVAEAASRFTDAMSAAHGSDVSNGGFELHLDPVVSPPNGWGAPTYGIAGDVWFTDTGQQSGSRAILLQNNSAIVTSELIPVFGSRAYEARIEWTGSNAADQMAATVEQFDAARTSLGSPVIVASATVGAAGVFEVTRGTFEALSSARFVRVRVGKIAGAGVITLDHVRLDLLYGGFFASITVAQNKTIGTFDFVPDSELYDHGQNYALGAGDFVAPADGFYQFALRAEIESNKPLVSPITTAALSFRKNGAVITSDRYGLAPGFGGALVVVTVSIQTPVFLAAKGDIFDSQIMADQDFDIVAGEFSGGRTGQRDG